MSPVREKLQILCSGCGSTTYAYRMPSHCPVCKMVWRYGEIFAPNDRKGPKQAPILPGSK